MKRFCLIVLILWTGCSPNNNGVLSVSGQIEGVSVSPGSRMGGRVDEVLVQEGGRVKKGDVLVRLEADEAEARVAAARAQLAQAKAHLAKLEAGPRPEQIGQAAAAVTRAEEQYRLAVTGFRSQEIEAARAAVEAARAKRDEAESSFRRAKHLVQEQAISQADFDRAKHVLQAEEAQLEGANERLDLLTQGSRAEEIGIAKAALDQAQAVLDELRNGARQEDIEAARALRDAAAAELQRAEAAAREMVVTAPCDGVVEAIDVHPGDLVKPGPIVRIVDPDDLELVVYVSAAALGRLRPGQEVPLTTDSHGDERFAGVIAQIASQGEFTPRNLQTQEERVQQMFGIKIKLDSAHGKLRAGMTATAHLTLDTGTG